MSEANKVVVRRYIEEMLNPGNFALADQFFSADSIFHGPNLPEVRGREARRRFFASLREAIPDYRLTVEELIAEGDKVAMRWSDTGTHRGEWLGVPASGKRICGSGTTTFRLVDGKITDEFVQADVLGFLQHVGAAPASIEANKAIVRRYFDELINQDKLALSDELFTADSIYHGPNFPEMRGRGARREHIASVRRAFPDFRCSVDEVVAEGNKVVVSWLLTGTHRGDFWGIAPTGKKISFSGTSIFRIRDAMIADEFMQWDALGYLQQHGLVPALFQYA